MRTIADIIESLIPNYKKSDGFMCIELDRARIRGDITSEECEQAKVVVQTRIGYRCTLDTFLHDIKPKYAYWSKLSIKGDKRTRIKANAVMKAMRVNFYLRMIKDLRNGQV